MFTSENLGLKCCVFQLSITICLLLKRHRANVCRLAPGQCVSGAESVHLYTVAMAAVKVISRSSSGHSSTMSDGSSHR